MKRHDHASVTITAGAVLVLLAASAPVRAATQLGEYFSIGGFGTVGGVRTNDGQAEFGRDRQIGGADKSVNFGVDSNLGVQLTGTATKWLSGTVQVLEAKRDEPHLTARVEWAYITVKPVDGLTLRGGRMATPAFLISDSRNIGYANTWVRAPNEVYALNVFRNFEGADATYRLPVGPVSLSVTGLTGKTSFRPLGESATGKSLRGVNVQMDTDWATFRASRVTTDVSVPAFNTYGDPYAFNEYGVTVDRDNIVAQAEYVQRRSGHQPTGTDSNGWYVLGGYRFGAVLPYAIVSRTAPQFAGSPFYLSSTQKTTALGVRWDALGWADVKFQFDRVNTDNTTGISFTTPLVFNGPGRPPGHAPVDQTVNVLSVTFDFTF